MNWLSRYADLAYCILRIVIGLCIGGIIVALSTSGDSVAKTVVIMGAVTGDVRAGEKVDIRATGSVTGDIVPPPLARFGLRASVVSGGLLCVLGAGLVAAAFPALRRYRSDIVAAAHSSTAL